MIERLARRADLVMPRVERARSRLKLHLWESPIATRPWSAMFWYTERMVLMSGNCSDIDLRLLVARSESKNAMHSESRESRPARPASWM